jgi:hypothetical protein
LIVTAGETNDVARTFATTTDADLQKFFSAIKDQTKYLTILAYACSAIAVILIPVAFIANLGRRSEHWQPKPWLASGRQASIGIIAIVFIIGAFVAWPVVLPQTLGTVAIFLIFVGALLFCLELSAQCYDRYGVPLISIFLIFWVVFGLLNINDSHIVTPQEQHATVATVPDAFKAWYRERADKDDYEKRQRPYPVFVVMAEGGGLYAAYHTATYLSRLQDRCPNFAQHLFAISGVSGGSLGGTVFATLAERFAQNGPSQQGCSAGSAVSDEFERRAHAFLSSDFMAPVVASWLFPEFLQSFLPFPIERFDRAKGFEASIEHAWTRVVAGGNTNPLSRFFSCSMVAERSRTGPRAQRH